METTELNNFVLLESERERERERERDRERERERVMGTPLFGL
jgi:hypothetical protein